MDSGNENFKHREIEDFDLASETGRNACFLYLKDWYAFVREKAASCTTALKACAQGVTNLGSEVGGNAVVVTYDKKDEKNPVKCIVAPSLGVNNCIRKIVSNKPQSGDDKDEGRTYTITYGKAEGGKPEKTYGLTLRRGDRGADGSTGEWGVYFKNGMKAIDPSVTGFSASGKGVSASFTGVSVGVTAVSFSGNIVSIKGGGYYRCRTAIGFKSDALDDGNNTLKTSVAAVGAQNMLLNFADVIAKVENGGIKQENNAVKTAVNTLKTNLPGLRTALNTMGLDVNT